MTQEDDVDKIYNELDRESFRKALQGSQKSLPQYVEDSVVRLHRIVATLLLMKDQLSGPTLDVASGNGILFRALKEYLPQMLPYSIAELFTADLTIEGQDIECHKFHCDKDRLPLEDNSVGAILFLDVIEHLIVDPMWTLLEFNRVLKPGGHLIVSTPNAAGAVRLQYILEGVNPGREIEYKPTAIYQRHNREWTVAELQHALKCSGFSDLFFSTHSHLLDPNERALIGLRSQLGLSEEFGQQYFGPEIFISGRKSYHYTVDDSDLPPELRWPTGLYGENDNYRKRPKQFPIVIGDDYR